MKLLKDTNSERMENLQKEMYNIIEMLQEEGKIRAECRYYKAISEILFSIFFALDVFRLVSLIFLGAIFGHLISQLF